MELRFHLPALQSEQLLFAPLAAQLLAGRLIVGQPALVMVDCRLLA